MPHDDVRHEHGAHDEAGDVEASPGVGTDGSLHRKYEQSQPLGVGTDGSVHSDDVQVDDEAGTDS